jgi:16S rRNA (guanine527-N7)-methyltransferase
MIDIDHISAGLRELRIDATAEQIALLGRHIEMVYETNAEMNLTAIPEDQAVPLHLLDCAAAAPLLAAAPQGPFADLGSGAGFPGITLSILSGRPVDLVESVKKKAAFLERVSGELCLKATVHPIRAEELAQEAPASFAVVTARALSALPSLVELAAPLLVRDGRLICLKGSPTAEEIERGDVVAAKCGMRRLAVTELRVPGVDGERVAIVYIRTGPARLKLPRRNGMAQRQPLA